MERKAKYPWVGVDVGTTLMKNSSMVSFRSTIEEKRGVKSSGMLVAFEGKEYLVGGMSNRFSTDINKDTRESVDVLVLTSIAKAFDGKTTIDCNLALGLPIEIYADKNESMKSILQTGKYYEIKIEKKTYSIRIHKIECYPESAGAYFTLDLNEGDEILVIDIGGMSVDCALMGEDIEGYATFSKLGILPLYSKLTGYLNAKYVTYNLNLGVWDMDKVLAKGLSLRGQIIDVRKDKVFEALIQDHAEDIVRELKLKFHLGKIQIILCGGGSILLWDYFKKIPDTSYCKLMDFAEYSNAIGYKILGEINHEEEEQD